MLDDVDDAGRAEQSCERRQDQRGARFLVDVRQQIGGAEVEEETAEEGELIGEKLRREIEKPGTHRTENRRRPR